MAERRDFSRRDLHDRSDEDWLAAALVRYTSPPPGRARDPALRDEIFRRARWLAVRGARRFADRGEPLDDLVQVAGIGLLKAIDRFDPSLGVPFGSYATPTILGELRRHFRDHTWSVRVPRRAKDLRSSVNAATDALQRELGRSPTVSEIAARLDLSPDAVLEVLEANQAYRARPLEHSAAVTQVVPDDAEHVLDREVLASLLEHLRPRERTILYLRYFDELSQSQIAARVGTSQVHVGRLIASSLAQLRAIVALGDVAPVDAPLGDVAPGDVALGDAAGGHGRTAAGLARRGRGYQTPPTADAPRATRAGRPDPPPVPDDVPDDRRVSGGGSSSATDPHDPGASSMAQTTDTSRPTRPTAASTPPATSPPATSPPATSTPPVTSRRHARFTVPTLSIEQGADVAERLQRRLVALLDLGLTLKHIHWNVVGPNFIAVHEMLDPQYEGVQGMVDDLAERIATLGGVPSGLPGRIVDQRRWDDYDLDRADSIAHLGALDLVYQGVIQDHRGEIDELAEIDPVTQDLLIGQTAILEKYHWFVRSHLADWAGGTANAGATSELAAAQAVAAKAHAPTGSRTARSAGDAGVSGTAATTDTARPEGR